MRFDDIKESALMAFDTLRTNKLRSSLTILGVTVGVVTVIFMVSIIQGLNKAFADQIESLGSNTIFVSKFDPSFGRPPGPEEIMTLHQVSTLSNQLCEHSLKSWFLVRFSYCEATIFYIAP
jgi:ABC-type lipoprotein release transport system permease subunit